MAATTTGVIAAISAASAAAGAYTSYKAGKDQKKEAKDAQKKALMTERREQQKAFSAQQSKAASGYGSTLGAGSSSLGG